MIVADIFKKTDAIMVTSVLPIRLQAGCSLMKPASNYQARSLISVLQK